MQADRSHLLQLAREPLQHNRSTMPIPSEKQIMEHVLDTMINRLPARPQRSDAYWWFLAEGGTSIDAARTVEDIVIWLSRSSQEVPKRTELDINSVTLSIQHIFEK